jgi:hypothetical protein
MENVEFSLNCLKTIDSKQGAVRAVRFNGKFISSVFKLPDRPNVEKLVVFVSFVTKRGGMRVAMQF